MSKHKVAQTTASADATAKLTAAERRQVKRAMLRYHQRKRDLANAVRQILDAESALRKHDESMDFRDIMTLHGMLRIVAKELASQLPNELLPEELRRTAPRSEATPASNAA